MVIFHGELLVITRGLSPKMRDFSLKTWPETIRTLWPKFSDCYPNFLIKPAAGDPPFSRLFPQWSWMICLFSQHENSSIFFWKSSWNFSNFPWKIMKTSPKITSRFTYFHITSAPSADRIFPWLLLAISGHIWPQVTPSRHCAQPNWQFPVLLGCHWNSDFGQGRKSLWDISGTSDWSSVGFFVGWKSLEFNGTSLVNIWWNHTPNDIRCFFWREKVWKI